MQESGSSLTCHFLNNSMVRSLALILVVAVFSASACGYRVASKNRIDNRFKTLAVKTLENQTTTFEIEQILTRSLIAEFVRSSSFQVKNSPGEAEAVLEGRIFQVLVSPVAFGKTAFASTFVVSVYADIVLKERATGQVIFENNDYVFRDQYVINVDVENFFSELNPALRRISDDFAASVVSTIMEEF